MRRGEGRHEKEKREWMMKEVEIVGEPSEPLKAWLLSCKISAAGKRVRRRRRRREGWRRTG